LALALRRRHLLMLAGGLPAMARAGRADTILDALRRGGLIMLMRHARTVPGTGDPPGFSLENCATQRNLSQAGREQARQIGARLRAERVAVGAVRSSAWCRCRETAELLDLGPVDHLQPLDSFFEDRSQAARHREGMLNFIAAWRGPGNAMLVTHQVNVTAVSGVFPASGEIVVMTAGEAPETLGQMRLWSEG
jgi:phosphohistidine phosphatase SixA